MSDEFNPVIDIIKSISISNFLNTGFGKDLNKLHDIYNRIQDDIYSLMDNGDPKGLASLKIGTVLIWSVVSKLFANKDKRITDFSEDDWKEIANTVSEIAIKPDGQSYTEWIFSMYSEYIRASANVIRRKNKKAITVLADELDEEKDKLHNGEISESVYVENCLWICLESIVKLLAAFVPDIGNSSEKTQAMAEFILQYGRMLLYKREQALLNAYLENQSRIDEALELEFENYKNELLGIVENIKNLIANAYDPDIRISLQNTAKLARTVGVPEEEILDSIDKIDNYFM